MVFSSDQVRAIKSLRPPGLHLLGFKPRRLLAEHHQLKHGYFVYPSDRQLEGSCTAFWALHRAMVGADVSGGLEACAPAALRLPLCACCCARALRASRL